MHFLTLWLFILLLVTLSLLDYHSTYYSLLETLGVNKRNLVIEKVEAAAKAQQNASKEVITVFESFQLISYFEGGELERLYKEIEAQYQSSETAAKKLAKRIEEIERLSARLFFEWQTELSLYQNPSLRLESETRLQHTQNSYQKMLYLMKNAERRMLFVLSSQKDSKLLLKHNLNANAIESLKSEFTDLKIDMNSAIEEMNQAIEQVNKEFSAICKDCATGSQSLAQASKAFIAQISTQQ